MQRVLRRCQELLSKACEYSSIPPEFLAALTANESGADPHAVRFEPSVYRHLLAVASGTAKAYGGIRREALEAEVEEMLHPKMEEFHLRYLTPVFDANYRQLVAASTDEALRELASSWGYTQIMGYHMVSRRGTARDLLEPERHYRIALELLAEFVDDFQLDPRYEFAELFRCWNTGQPYGKTFDPHYVEKGLRRMEIYRRLLQSRAEAAGVATT